MENLARPRPYLDLAKVMGGTLSRNLLRGILKLLVAGFLTVEAFGILRAVFSLFKMVSSLVSLGLDNTTVTFLAAAIKRRDDAEQSSVLRTVLSIKLALGASLFAAGFLVAPTVARLALGDPALTGYVRLALLAVAGQLVWKLIASYLSGTQQFSRLALFLTTMPLLMLVAAGLLIASELFDLRSAVWIYLAAPTVTALAWWWVIEARCRRPGWDGGCARRMLGYGRWIYLSGLASTGRSHLNPLLLKSPQLSGSLNAGEANAGLYGFGNDLANEITVVSESLVAVLLPRASRKTDTAKLRRFVGRSYRKLVLLLAPLTLLVFAAEPLIRLLGRFKSSYLDYLPSVSVFTILYLGALVSLAVIPMRTALQALRRPQLESYLELGTMVILVGASIALIPRFGAEGAAVAVLVQRLVTFVVLMGYGIAVLRGEPAAD